MSDTGSRADRAGRAPRLFVDDDLSDGAAIALGRDRAHYLGTVLRRRQGEPVLVFNGRDGEWLAGIGDLSRKSGRLDVVRQTREQSLAADIDYLFAPLKHARLDYMVQKAAEMGAARLRPVLTRRTVVARVNVARMRANAIEAAEQCGVLSVPEVAEPRRLEQIVGDWDPARVLIFADESADAESPVATLASLAGSKLAVLVGPEGGFDDAERRTLLDLPFTRPISLGPRILRADTAAVAALALVQAVIGDWPRPAGTNA